MSASEIALEARLLAELDELRHVASRAQSLAAKARTMNDPDYLDGAALNLHGFYAGAERILSEITREIDGAAPTGPEWHRDLPMQASGEIAGIRPPIISRETRNCLDEYRGFRHVVRNVYTFSLRPARIHELAEEAPACLDQFDRDIRTFCSFLDQLADEE